MRLTKKDIWCDKCFNAGGKLVLAYAKITKEDYVRGYSEYVCSKHLREWRLPFSTHGGGKFADLNYNKIVIERIR
jgi:hypothetical protein